MELDPVVKHRCVGRALPAGEGMNRHDAYAVLADRLNRLRDVGSAGCFRLVGQRPLTEAVRIHGEEITIEITVEWADEKRGTLRVRGSALGPSTWSMERLDEEFLLSVNPS